ncbi:MAG: YybH family protein [Mucilaginibacter sp.]
MMGSKILAHPMLTTKQDTNAVKAALSKVNKDYGEAFIKGDSSLFLNSYALDACIMPANSPSLCGRDGELAFYKFVYKMGIRNIVFTPAGLFGLTDQYVTEQGKYEMFDANGKSLGKGKFLVLWKKTADGWKMYRDMFNSDTPPVRPAK